jgi:hypothetical protein
MQLFGAIAHEIIRVCATPEDRNNALDFRWATAMEESTGLLPNDSMKVRGGPGSI